MPASKHMGNENVTERHKVESLAELDALVGRYLTGEEPQTHWEDSHAQLRFDSIEEALEALRDPYFQQFIPEEDRARTILREVREFPAYSSDLDLAWQVVEKMSNRADALLIVQEQGMWRACFGTWPSVTAETPALAICVAALMARGLDIDFAQGVECAPKALSVSSS
ncbi:MAG TPA: hypothetical protein VGO90_06655 [Chthoniobacteraceae bacterium]|jgi:hypothetical protein|nr:hypothetical protein [Chthoniobacter sp.]HEV7867343.1 hypothetical protein [Chthoniobacteraceae bacterium]